jgi:DNA polymerase-3 subunit beta
MKLTIPHDALLAPLSALARVVERRNTIPILSNILLRADASGLGLKATDLDIEATARIACDVAEAGAITVPAHLLHDITRKIPDGAQVTLATEDTRLILRSGRSRFTMQTLPESDFPDIAAGEFSHSFALPAKDLRALIGQVDFAICTEEMRYYLNGIYLHTLEKDGEERLRAVATDGYRLARLERPAPEGSGGMPGVIVPRKAVTELGRLARDHEGDVAFDLSAQKIRASFGEGAAVITSKLIDGTFPDYQRVIPTGNDRSVTLDRAELLAAVDRVSTISSERGRAVKLGLAGNVLTLSVNNPDAGAANEEIAVEHEGAPLEVGFNARYLADILGVLEGGENVLMKLADPGSPAILQTSEGADLLIVLVTMRV